MAGQDLTDITEQVIPLTEMIASLRRELAVATVQADDITGPKLRVKQCEIQLQVALRKATEGQAGLKWYAILTTKHTRAVDNLYTIKLQLEPDPDEGPILVSDPTDDLE